MSCFKRKTLTISLLQRRNMKHQTPNTVLLCFLMALTLPILHAQSGCTDPQAQNYTATATQNDGSCTYPTTNYTLVQKAKIDEQLAENSGLCYAQGSLWTHNDNGAEALFYRIDTITGNILQRVRLANTANIDWEDMATDGTNLYIGDFGNNVTGVRRDLRVLKVAFSAIPNGADVVVPENRIETITFRYEDQTDFTSAGINRTAFDCEAFFFRAGTLHLFTKDWLNNVTTHYTLAVSAGTHIAQKQQVLRANGLVTGADVAPDGSIALVGYNGSNGAVFLWLLRDYTGVAFFSGHKRRIELGSAINVGQVEGITFRQNNYGYISNENFTVTVGGGTINAPAKLWSFSTAAWTSRTSSSKSINNLDNRCKRLNLAALNAALPTWPDNTRLQLLSLDGRLIWSGTPQDYPLQAFSAGQYVVQAISASAACAQIIQLF
jgi:hypothetical protein